MPRALLLLFFLFLGGCAEPPIRVAATYADQGFDYKSPGGRRVRISGEIQRLEQGTYAPAYTFVLRVMANGREAFAGGLNPSTVSGTVGGSIDGRPAGAVCISSGFWSRDVSCQVSVDGALVGTLRF